MQITDFHINTQLQQVINAEQAHYYRIIPSDQTNGDLSFLTDSNNPDQIKNELEIILGKKIFLTIESSDIIQKII